MSTSPDIFLSYSRDDQSTARRFAEAFERQGFRVWWDAALRSGEAWDQEIEKALKTAKAVVVLWSKNSVDSRWVRAEATLADRNKTLVPVMIELCERPIMFELTHTADLSHWSGDAKDKAWRSFVIDLRQFVQRGAPDRVAAPTGSRSHGSAAADPWYRSRNGTIALVAVPTLIIAALLLVLLRNPTPMAQPAGGSVTATAAPGAAAVVPQAAPAGVSLAVLPFADMSPQHDQDYFSDGLSEELLNQLAQIKDLQVSGRTSSFSFKGKTEDLRVIGEKLGVNRLLEGSVRKDGKHLRITAQLINAATGAQLWSQTYDRNLNDVFAVQEEIATDVASTLRVLLNVGDIAPADGRTTNVDAYDKYLRAVALADKGGPEDLQHAVEFYRQAVALDRNFASAWYGLYTALSSSLVYTPENDDEIKAEMLDAGNHVSALAPNAWWTHAMHAEQLWGRHQWLQAQAEAIAAVASAPASEPDAVLAYAILLRESGRLTEACQYFKRARGADPLSLRISGALQYCLTLAGRGAEAQTEYERSRDLGGDHTEWDFYAFARLLSRKDVDPGVVNANFRDFVAHENIALALDHVLLGRLQDKAFALASIRRAFEGPASQRDWPRLGILAVYADHYGDLDLALAGLQRRVEIHGDHYFGWWPFETHLRADPRFKQIVRKLKLDEYWRATGNWGDFCHSEGKDDFACQ